MAITYHTNKNLNAIQLKALFQSVEWLSANYPERLEKAINNSSTVISAWDGEDLVGLVNALDDSELTAYVHYLLVNPSYQGQGIGCELLNQIKKHYEGYLYLILMAEEKEKVGFYTEHSFKILASSTPLGIITL